MMRAAIGVRARLPVRVAFAAVSLWLAVPRVAGAQSAFPPGRFEAGALVSWSAEDDLGSRSAALTRNASVDMTPFILFSTESRVRAGVGLRGTFAYRAAAWLTAEAGGQFRRADVAISVRSDAEGAADRTFIGERLDQYIVEGSALVKLPVFQSPRLWPFAMAGVGYRRDVHEGRLAIDEGRSVHAGGGVKWVIRTRRRGWMKGIGARADARVTRRSGGFHLDRATAVTAAAGGGVFFVF